MELQDRSGTLGSLGSYKGGVISRVTIVITHISRLITILINP